ncbi:hypothetical protein [Texcoconibacillus texcoconensis]|uniref:Methyl-accepting chemotaxis protein n=1 Tax=Texcoconibacillus texcoconensis TaxID=1095777 RepID=A0A840QPT4_9BACI|nr:hypothetical protein [Texcoconibacillus texcoconensis]MBB5173369.1 methyl-accepting chemotaxis protein [Texcoconibacillus texcoconensis]
MNNNISMTLMEQVSRIDPDIFITNYMQIMTGIFILLFILVLLWYGNSFVRNRAIKNKLANLKNQDIKKIDEFNNWINSQSKVVKKLNSEWLKAWNSYYGRYRQFLEEGNIYYPDVYDYILEENLVHKNGCRKLLEAIPGIFVSIGILGTFIGLVAGIEGLTMDADSSTIQSGIQDLISGMEMAFYSSILGISFSLIWQLLDKIVLYPMLLETFVNNRDEMDKAFPTQDQGNTLLSLIETQKEQMENFQDVMSNTLIPQMVSGIQEGISNVMEPHFERTNNIVEQALEKSSEKQAEGLQEMVDEFVSSLNNETSDYFNQLSETLEKMASWQENVFQEMDHFLHSMNESAKKQSEMVESTTKLTSDIHAYTEQVTSYHTFLQETVDKLDSTTSTQSELQSSMSNTLESVREEQTIIDNSMKLLHENLEKAQSYSSGQLAFQDRFQHLLDSMDTHLSAVSETASTNQVLSETLSEHVNLVQNNNESLNNILDKFHQQAEVYHLVQESIENTLRNVMDERERLDNVSSFIQESKDTQIEAMDERNQKINEFWKETVQQLDDMNRQLSQSMNQFSEQMHQGLARTFDQFDEELGKAIQNLSKGVDSIRTGTEEIYESVEGLPTEVERFNQLMKTLNTYMKEESGQK